MLTLLCLHLLKHLLRRSQLPRRPSHDQRPKRGVNEHPDRPCVTTDLSSHLLVVLRGPGASQVIHPNQILGIVRQPKFRRHGTATFGGLSTHWLVQFAHQPSPQRNPPPFFAHDDSMPFITPSYP